MKSSSNFFFRFFCALFFAFLMQSENSAFSAPSFKDLKALEFYVNSIEDSDDNNPGDGICESASDVCTLRAAVTEANASAGDSIINLPEGIFQFTIHPNQQAHLIINNTITIQGISPQETVIDGNLVSPSGTRLPVIYSYGNLTLKRLSIINGYQWVSGAGGVTDPYEVYGAITSRRELAIDEVVLKNNVMGIYAVPITISGIPQTTPQVSVNNSTIQDNGEGIVTNGIMNVNNSTISGNQYRGVEIVGGNTIISSSTIVGNFAWSEGAGIGVWSSNAVVTIDHTILAGNFGPSPDCYGQINSGGYNIIGTVGDCVFLVSQGDLTNVAALTAPIGYYGGTTPTIALFQNSPAIDGGNPSGCGKSIDQRGMSRPVDGNRDGSAVCDIGAYEVQFTTYLPVVVK